MGSWCILTGEYPPTIGGVSAYTQSIAVGLARAGDTVDVWAPPGRGGAGGELARDPGVEAHVLPDHFGPRSLLLLERELAKRPEARVLVQYVPQAYGMRSMNVPFALWLAARGRPYWIMVHEVAFPIHWKAPWRHNVIGVVTHGMAAALARRAERILVSTSAWNPQLARLAPRAATPVCIPIPSNIPAEVDLAAVARARDELGIARDDLVVGSFGTYASSVAPLLVATLEPLLARNPRLVALLVGRGSIELADHVFVPPEARKARVIAVGERDPHVVAAYLSACTVLLQPYVDGITTRRTSAMAGLALGVPVITNMGPLAEPMWTGSGAVVLAPEPTADALVRATESTLADAELRARVGARGREFYGRSISLEYAIRTLRS